MRENEIIELLNNFKDGKIESSFIVEKLRELPYEDLGYAKIDHHRELRTGYPEVIYTEGKTYEQVLGIVNSMFSRGESNIICTRCCREYYEKISLEFNTQYYDLARIMVVNPVDIVVTNTSIGIAAAGTSDLKVAEEAAVIAELFGNKVERFYDVGVAGIHRLLNNIERIRKSSILIAVAGMEGALPSVLAGLVDVPVIAVPTSIGYGASMGGLAALLAMLNSCSSGITVVNIDNGFGAAFFASMVNRIADKAHTEAK